MDSRLTIEQSKFVEKTNTEALSQAKQLKEWAVEHFKKWAGKLGNFYVDLPHKKILRKMLRKIAEIPSDDFYLYIDILDITVISIMQYMKQHPFTDVRLTNQLHLYLFDLKKSINKYKNCEEKYEKLEQKLEYIDIYVTRYASGIKIKIPDFCYAAFLKEEIFIQDIRPLILAKELHEQESLQIGGMYEITNQQFIRLQEKLSKLTINTSTTEKFYKIMRVEIMFTIKQIQQIFKLFSRAVNGFEPLWFDAAYNARLTALQQSIKDFSDLNEKFLNQDTSNVSDREGMSMNISIELRETLSLGLKQLIDQWRNTVETVCPRKIKDTEHYANVTQALRDYDTFLWDNTRALKAECERQNKNLGDSEIKQYGHENLFKSKDRLQGEYKELQRIYESTDLKKSALQTLVGSFNSIVDTYIAHRENAVLFLQSMKTLMDPIQGIVKQLFEKLTQEGIVELPRLLAPPAVSTSAQVIRQVPEPTATDAFVVPLPLEVDDEKSINVSRKKPGPRDRFFDQSRVSSSSSSSLSYASVAASSGNRR